MPGPQVVIQGFSSSDRVPGFYGETQYGVGAQSASDLPLQLLLIGQMASGGTATPNQDLNQILDVATARTLYKAGSELMRMCKVALATTGVSVWAMPLAAAGGAVAASMTITVVAGQVIAGTYYYRVSGETSSIVIGATDNATTIAANLAADINSHGDWPFTATPVAGVITLTFKSLGARGNAQTFYQILSSVPAGATFTFGGGGTALTGGGYLFGNGVGVESTATGLSLIVTTQYDRMAWANTDTAALDAIKAQVDTQAGPLGGLTQHCVFGLNSPASSTATTLASGAHMNEQRFQLTWLQNAEQHPSEQAASIASLRTGTEQEDPDAMYDDVVVPGGAGQSYKGDQPSHSTLVSCINNGVTPLYTAADGTVRVCRSIVTRCLNGSVPDYSTLDTGDAVVPDYVRTDLKLYWTTKFKPSNPRVADNPLPTEKARPSGIATPDLWTGAVTGRLRAHERGETTPAGLPIIINVDTHLSFSTYDSVAKRIMSAVLVEAAPGNHQTGVSVRQTAA